MLTDGFVIGYGMVGKATAKALGIPWYFSSKESNISLEDASKKLFCFICLPTPTDEKGQQQGIDTIFNYIKQIQQYNGRNIFIIRSTVLPGTCRNLIRETGARVVSNPEFLSEATAEEDAKKPRIKVIGGDRIPELNAVKQVWKDIPCKLEIETDTVTAETIKYTFNTFAAVKVVFANALYDSCQKTGADFNKVHHALHFHPWGSKEHLNAVHKGGRGCGGRCIPKDLKAFAKFTDSELLKTVEELNTNYLHMSHKV